MEVTNMFNRKELFIKVGTMLMTFGVIVPFSGSVVLFGEPTLPKKFQR